MVARRSVWLRGLAWLSVCTWIYCIGKDIEGMCWNVRNTNHASTLAQRKRVGLITQRSLDRNQQVLWYIFLFHSHFSFNYFITFLSYTHLVQIVLYNISVYILLFPLFHYCLIPHILAFSLSRILTFSLSHTITLSYYHTIILSYYHTIILSYYHTIILSYCHTIILSYYHTIILSSLYQPCTQCIHCTLN